MLKNWVLVAVSLASCTSALADPTPYPGQYEVRDNRHGDYRDDRRGDRRGDHYGDYRDDRRDDDDLLNERPQGFTCVSSSNYNYFIGEDTMQLMAKTNAIRACQSSGATNNAECAANVECRPNYSSSRQYECTTDSNTLPFVASGSNELKTRISVIKSCQASGATNNAACAQNVQCKSSHYNPNAYYSCASESNGLIFTSRGPDSAVAKTDAIHSCQASGATNNAQCMSSVSCERVERDMIPRTVCTTESNSIPFTLEESKYRFEVMADVVRSCQASGATNNTQCRQNVQCETERY